MHYVQISSLIKYHRLYHPFPIYSSKSCPVFNLFTYDTQATSFIYLSQSIFYVFYARIFFPPKRSLQVCVWEKKKDWEASWAWVGVNRPVSRQLKSCVSVQYRCRAAQAENQMQTHITEGFGKGPIILSNLNKTDHLREIKACTKKNVWTIHRGVNCGVCLPESGVEGSLGHSQLLKPGMAMEPVSIIIIVLLVITSVRSF